MLTAFRAFAKSWVAALLIGLLIISFAVFGMSDVLRGQFSDSVVTAGDRSVDGQEFRREYDNWRRGAEQQAGQAITPQMAAENGVIGGLLEQIAIREAMGALLHKLGLRPSDDLVAKQLREIRGFFDPVSGRFDPNLMERVLAENNLTGDQFLRGLKDQVAETHFAAGLVGGLRAPRAYGALNALVDLEERDIAYFPVGVGAVEAPGAPTDEQLQAFMQENADNLRRPEFRVLSVVRFAPRPEDVPAQLSEQDIQARFDFRKDTLSQPETRTLVQVPARDQAAAQRIVQRLRAGEDPAAVARDLGVEPVRYDDRPRTSIADRVVAEAAFALDEGQVSDPIQGGLGLAVVKVLKVTPGRSPTLADVRPLIEAELRRDAATEKVYERTQAYEQAHLGGASLSEAAETAGAVVVTLPAVSEDGRGQDGGPVEGISPQMVQTAFQLAEGAESDLVEGGQGDYFAVKVERIIPPALPPLDELRPVLTRVWMQREMVRRLQAKADALAEEVRGGKTMEAAASSIGARVTRAAALTRTNAQEGGRLSDDALVTAFGASANEVFRASDVQFGMIVGRLEAIRPGSAQAAAGLTEAARPQLTMAMFRDISQAASLAARDKVKVRVDEARARAVLGLDAEAAPAAKAPAKSAEPKA